MSPDQYQPASRKCFCTFKTSAARQRNVHRPNHSPAGGSHGGEQQRRGGPVHPPPLLALVAAAGTRSPPIYLQPLRESAVAVMSHRLARARQPRRRSAGAGALSYVTRPPLCLFSHNFLNLLGGWGKEPLFCFGCEVLDALLPGLRPSDPSNEDRLRED